MARQGEAVTPRLAVTAGAVPVHRTPAPARGPRDAGAIAHDRAHANAIETESARKRLSLRRTKSAEKKGFQQSKKAT